MAFFNYCIFLPIRFPVDEKGRRVTLVRYFGENCRLQYGSWPHFQTGSHPQPMEVRNP